MFTAVLRMLCKMATMEAESPWKLAIEENQRRLDGSLHLMGKTVGREKSWQV